MDSDSFNLASALLKAGAVQLSPADPFIWASGLKSPVYCDNRLLLGFPSVRSEVAAALSVHILAGERMPTLIAGTSTAGIPWASLVADRLGLPLAYVRPNPKKHGMGRQVEGPSAAGHRTVLIEDLISTGGSSLQCAQALRAEGAEVVGVLALFSYELPVALDSFSRVGLGVHLLATFSELVNCAAAAGQLDEAGLASLAEWRADPQGWSDRVKS